MESFLLFLMSVRGIMFLATFSLLPELASEIKEKIRRELHRRRTLHWQELAQHWGHLQWQAQVERARRPFIRRGG